MLLTTFNQQRSQFLNRYKEFASNLLLQHLSEQPAKRAHITTQRCFLEIAVVAYQLSQPRRLIVYFPEWFSSPHAFIPQLRKSISQLHNFLNPAKPSSSTRNPE